jgi:protocatechuate 3,4-dioxygenase beta subunit
MRPPHIHFKIARLGYHELVTQMYFRGNPYNDRDLILQAVPAAERDGVIVDFTPSALDPNTLGGTFDITLQAVRRA